MNNRRWQTKLIGFFRCKKESGNLLDYYIFLKVFALYLTATKLIKIDRIPVFKFSRSIDSNYFNQYQP